MIQFTLKTFLSRVNSTKLSWGKLNLVEFGILVGIGGLLLLFPFPVGYNQPNENLSNTVNAQQVELVCSQKEIPVGTLVEAADKFHQNLLSALLQMASSAKAQVEASEILLGAARLCKAESCTSQCTKVCVNKGAFGCRKWECVANTCTGDPCDRNEISKRAAALETLYGQVLRGQQAINNLLHERVQDPFRSCPPDCVERTQRENMMAALQETRNALKSCVTPANAYEEDVQRVDQLYSCQEAKFLRVLNDQQAQCSPNNFFCCSLQSR